jgi:predicted nucleic acid-binding protein
VKFILDTNVMLLLAIGTADEAWIEQHKRTKSRAFKAEHYKQLVGMIGKVTNLATTSNILTEVSNLLNQSKDPKKHRVLVNVLFELISKIPEIHLPGKLIVNDPIFLRLGLTDALILKLEKGQYHILSVDGPLCYACASVGLPYTNLTPVFFE